MNCGITAVGMGIILNVIAMCYSFDHEHCMIDKMLTLSIIGKSLAIHSYNSYNKMHVVLSINTIYYINILLLCHL